MLVYMKHSVYAGVYETSCCLHTSCFQWQFKQPALNYAALFDQLVLPLLNVLALRRRTLWCPRQQYSPCC